MQAIFSISSGESVGEVPGLWSVAIAIGTPASRRRRPAAAGLAQEVEGARQQHRDGAGPRHRLDAGLAQVLEVVAGQRAEARRPAPRRPVGQLLGVQLDRQPERARALEHAPRLRRRERDALAERVDGVDEPLGMERRQPIATASM